MNFENFQFPEKYCNWHYYTINCEYFKMNIFDFFQNYAERWQASVFVKNLKQNFSSIYSQYYVGVKIGWKNYFTKQLLLFSQFVSVITKLSSIKIIFPSTNNAKIRFFLEKIISIELKFTICPSNSGIKWMILP